MWYKKKYEGRIKFFYHVGVIAFLLGFGLALVPQPGAAAYGFLWIASGVAFVAVAVNACLDVKRAWNNRNIADRGGRRMADPFSHLWSRVRRTSGSRPMPLSPGRSAAAVLAHAAPNGEARGEAAAGLVGS